MHVLTATRNTQSQYCVSHKILWIKTFKYCELYQSQDQNPYTNPLYGMYCVRYYWIMKKLHDDEKLNYYPLKYVYTRYYLHVYVILHICCPIMKTEVHFVRFINAMMLMCDRLVVIILYTLCVCWVYIHVWMMYICMYISLYKCVYTYLLPLVIMVVLVIE